MVRYGLLTNEIAQQQASGRARASDSVYSVVAQAGGREVRRELLNECLEDLTGRAIGEVQRMEHREFQMKVRRFLMVVRLVSFSMFYPCMSLITLEKRTDLHSLTFLFSRICLLNPAPK